MDLYAERGYDQTTVAEIAERAGVTERTFFRHFADKREVLFDASGRLEEALVIGVAGSPPSAVPIEAIAQGLEAAATLLQERRGRDFARRRQSIIAANPELQERELIKLASMATAVTGALRARGFADPASSLGGEISIAVFRTAFKRWIDDARNRDFQQLIGESLEALTALGAGERRATSKPIRRRARVTSA